MLLNIRFLTLKRAYVCNVGEILGYRTVTVFFTFVFKFNPRLPQISDSSGETREDTVKFNGAILQLGAVDCCGPVAPDEEISGCFHSHHQAQGHIWDLKTHPDTSEII